MVGRGVHRVDQRGEGPAQLRRPLSAASARRSGLLRPALAGGAAPPGAAGAALRHRGILRLLLQFRQPAGAVAADRDGAAPIPTFPSAGACAGRTRTGRSTGTAASARSCWRRATIRPTLDAHHRRRGGPGRRPALHPGERAADVPGVPPAAAARPARPSPRSAARPSPRPGFAGVHLVYVESMEAVDRRGEARPVWGSTPASSFRRTAARWPPPATPRSSSRGGTAIAMTIPKR